MRAIGLGFFAIIVLMFVGFFLLVRKLFLKSKNEAWTGEVIDKYHTEWDDEDSVNKDYYTLKIKIDDGKVRKFNVNKELFDKVEAGDKIKKEKGSSLPKKI